MFARALVVAALLTLGSGPALRANPGAWAIDRAHSRVTFTVTKWGFVDVEGRFKRFSGTLAYDQAHPEQSHISWSVEVASVDTGEPKRDQALQSEEYFNAAQYPLLKFDSDRVSVRADGQLEVAGRLAIRGVTKPLTILVTPRGVHDLGSEGIMEAFETSFTINRYDFGVVGGSVLGPAISKEVRIHLIAAAQKP